MNYTHIIWDFNGTLFSDMDAGIKSVNTMLSDRSLPIIPDLDSYREVFKFPIIEYYRDLGFDFEKEPYEVLAPIWVGIYNDKSKDSKTVDGVIETLEAIGEMGIKQVVFSATERTMLLRQLEHLGVISYFDEIIGLENIHAESKIHLAKKWGAEHPEAKILYVGDTVHDAENAKILGADCLLFTGGHQSRRRLEACGCAMIDKIEEMIEYIK